MHDSGERPARPRSEAFVGNPVALVDDLARLSRDPHRTRRHAVAFTLATALTLLALALLHPQAAAPPATPAPVVNVAIERATPPPTPRPPPTPLSTPSPPPAPRPVVGVTPAAVAQRAAPHARAPRGGVHAARPASPHPAAAAAGLGSGPGAGNGSEAGNGGGAGNGSGGNGNENVDADVPCGFVEFIPTESPRLVDGVAYERIRATVHFPDGHTQSGEFPYPWVYPDAAQSDPWSPENLRKPNFTVHAQLPPPGANTSRYSEVIKYVLDHTTPDGVTVLQECPSGVQGSLAPAARA